MEEIIILVTDCDLRGSWTNIAFLREWADAQVSFGVNLKVGGELVPKAGDDDGYMSA